MLKCNIGYLMVDHKIKTITELVNLTGLSRDTLTKIRDHSKLETVKLETYLKLCDYFKCNLSDLIEYIPEKDSE